MSKRRRVDRRKFLAGSAGALGAAFFKRLPLGAMAEQAAPPAPVNWDPGQVRHNYFIAWLDLQGKHCKVEGIIAV